MYTINLWCPRCRGNGSWEQEYTECCQRYHEDQAGGLYCCNQPVRSVYPEQCEACHGSGAGEMYLELNGVLKKEEMLL